MEVFEIATIVAGVSFAVGAVVLMWKIVPAIMESLSIIHNRVQVLEQSMSTVREDCDDNYEIFQGLCQVLAHLSSGVEVLQDRLFWKFGDGGMTEMITNPTDSVLRVKAVHPDEYQRQLERGKHREGVIDGLLWWFLLDGIENGDLNASGLSSAHMDFLTSSTVGLRGQLELGDQSRKWYEVEGNQLYVELLDRMIAALGIEVASPEPISGRRSRDEMLDELQGREGWEPPTPPDSPPEPPRDVSGASSDEDDDMFDSGSYDLK